MTKQKHLNQRRNKAQKKKDLTRLSSIMKGVLVYKTETEELYRLMAKYPEIGYLVATGASAQKLSFL